jgi:hypothetical protein
VSDAGDCVAKCCELKPLVSCETEFVASGSQCGPGLEPSAGILCMVDYNCTTELCCVPSPCRTPPVLDAADNTALALCAAGPFEHLGTCTIACLNVSYVPVGAQADATMMCVSGDWVKPVINPLTCARSCLSASYCTGVYEQKQGVCDTGFVEQRLCI